jgi:hypothetical protein
MRPVIGNEIKADRSELEVESNRGAQAPRLLSTPGLLAFELNQ